ncbi:MAG: MG2 domain-containing protein, partial [Pyrinomonadaceae bacterium]
MWYLEFSNSIDASKFNKDMVKIEPAVEGLTIYPSGNYIYIQGYKKGRTTYKVTIDGALPDIYGQTLGKPGIATMRVGSADQSLYAQGGTMTVIDPTSKPTYSIYSMNHSSVKVRMYAVEPQDWRQFQDYLRHINYDDGKRPVIPGRLVSDKIVSIENKPDEMVETRIDVSPALNGGYGSVILDVEPTVKKDKYDRTHIFTWVLATQIGLDAFVDNNELVGFATELRSGKPLAGVDLSIYPNGKSVGGQQSSVSSQNRYGFLQNAWNWMWGSSQAEDIQSVESDGSSGAIETIPEAQTNRTADNGVLRLSLPEIVSEKGPNMLIAKRGKDVSFLPENTDYYWQDSGSWYKKADSDSLRWFVFDDRKMYKPKEGVAIKGYIRKITGGKLGDVEGLGGQIQKYDWSAKDSRNNEIAKGTVSTNPFGAFDLKFSIPDNSNLGASRVDFSEPGSPTAIAYSHQFQIQEFRRPEFEVSTKVESEAPLFVGGNAVVSVEAKYYAGGGLANAETNWTVTASPTNYTPPNRGDYTFGTWTPWWRVYDYGDYGYGGRGYGGSSSQSFKGVTDASGKHLLKIDFESVKPARSYTITAAASVQDVNRQTWSSSTSMLVHPSSLYIGIKTPRTFVQKGEKIEVESIVSDIDGNLVKDRNAEIKAVLKDWQFDKGTWQEVTVDEQTCTVKSSDTAQKCSFVAKQGGRYTITATVMDDKERF